MLQKEMFQKGSMLGTETSNISRNKVIMGGVGRQVCQPEQERHS